MRKPSPATLDRRTALAGAGAVGALAAAAALLPGEKPAPAVATAAASGQPDKTAGYQLTEHVKRYYATARV